MSFVNPTFKITKRTTCPSQLLKCLFEPLCVFHRSNQKENTSNLCFFLLCIYVLCEGQGTYLPNQETLCWPYMETTSPWAISYLCYLSIMTKHCGICFYHHILLIWIEQPLFYHFSCDKMTLGRFGISQTTQREKIKTF